MSTKVTAKDVYESGVRMSPWDLSELFLSGFNRGDLAIYKSGGIEGLVNTNFVLRDHIDVRSAHLLDYNESRSGSSILTNNAAIIISIEAVILRRHRGAYQKQRLTTRELPVEEFKVIPHVHLFCNERDWLVVTKELLSNVFVSCGR